MSALVAVLLTAAPSALVLPEDDGARAAAQTVVSVLNRSNVAARLTTAGRSCLALQKRTDCLADAAQVAWVDAILVVSVAGDAKSSALSLETVMRKTRKKLDDVEAVGTPEVLDDLLAKALSKITAALKAAARPAPAPGPSTPAPQPAPMAGADPAPATGPEVDAAFERHDATLVPKPAPDAPEAPALTATPPPARPRVAAWATTGVGVAGLAAGIGLGAVAISERGQLSAANPSTRISPLSYEQARGLRDSANQHQGAAIACAALGAAALGVAIYLFAD